MGFFDVFDFNEFIRVVDVVVKFKLKYVVIMSVDWDDFGDGGVEYFVNVICVIKDKFLMIIIEVFMLDFFCKGSVYEIVIDVKLDVFNYNLEIVLCFYFLIWFGVCYFYLLWFLEKVKEKDLL